MVSPSVKELPEKLVDDQKSLDELQLLTLNQFNNELEIVQVNTLFMRFLLSSFLSCCLALGLIWGIPTDTFAQKTTYLHCGAVVDCKGADAAKEQTIVIKDNEIEEVLAGYRGAPAGVEVIDLKAHTVMPGFTMVRDWGKMADIVAVKGDPLADISILQKMNFVMKNGVVFKNEY